MNKLLNKKEILFLLVLFLLPTHVFGANLFFEPNDKILSVGNDFLVSVFLDSEGQSLNAISGKVVFDPNVLEIKELRDGNSSINFWVEKAESKTEGEITFSGITPGGLSGSKNRLFEIVFRPKVATETSIKLSNAQALKNDGNGTSVKTNVQQLKLSINKDENHNSSGLLIVEDKEPPERFIPYLASDPEIFSGQYFLVFKAEDKGVGIDHYEIKEGFWGKYVKAESPYLIEDQTLSKNIYVKAIDKSLNERVVIFKPNGEWYQQYLVLGIIILTIIAFVFVLKKIWARFTK